MDPSRIPDALAQGALLLHDLEGRGVVEEAAQRLKIRRQGGYSAVDAWLTLLLYLSSGVAQGFRPFWARMKPHVQQLAALGGRKRLPAPASVSRALNAVEPELLRETTSWLLTEAPEVDEVLRHPSTLARDAQGAGWHLFDLDPTVTTLRHRALPVDDDLPEPIRRSEETGAPGHSGRKRGDIQYRRVDVQHAGSGVWVHAHLHTGNGHGVADLDLALANVQALANRLEHPLTRTLVRMDGEYGSVPFFATCRARGLPFVTRLNRPKLFEDPDVLALLRDATWYEVPDSKSGPARAAAELGVVTVHPGRDTRRPDGTAYEPITIRVVASAIPKEGKAQRGRVLDGWQVELFAADVPAEAWPAPEIVAAYFGRAGQENRFAQEDREVGLDRIISYHLPGQEFATLTGLFLLNLRIARGFALDKPPAVTPAPTLRRARVDERLSGAWPRDPVVTELLERLDWNSMLRRREGWTWDGSSGVLSCPDGRPLVLTTIRPSEHAAGRTCVIFCRPHAGCAECSVREGCLRSDRRDAVKHAEFSIPTEIAEKLRTRLALVRGKKEADKPTEIEAVECKAGLHAAITPRFLPAAARRRFEEVFLGATLHVEVDLPPPPAPRPRLVARDEADRQQRRLTWAQRHTANALPDDAVVRLDVRGGPDLKLLLAPPEPELRMGVGCE